MDKYLNMSDSELVLELKKAGHRYEDSDVYDLLYAATIRIATLSATLNADKGDES